MIIIQQVVPVYVLELNNGIQICWTVTPAYNVAADTSTWYILNLPTTYNTFYRVYGSACSGGNNWAITQALIIYSSNSQYRILPYCHNVSSQNCSWTILTIGY